jgi:uncharacterized protein
MAHAPSTLQRFPMGLAPDALGIGLRPAHYSAIAEGTSPIGFLEIISENYLDASSIARQRLDQIRLHYPVVMHGVSLNLLGNEPLDEVYLDQVCRLADQIEAPFVTDHLCWTGARALAHHDLLPVPYTNDLLELAAQRADYVQRRLGRPFGLENLSSYLQFHDSTMPEWEFYSGVVEQARCWFMLDLNNIYVSSVNHGFDASTYLDAIRFDRVLQVHLAGHTVEADGTVIDTHDQPVCNPVWDLYAEAWRRGGPFPTLLERDAAIPPLPALLIELETARRVRAGGNV